MIGRIVFALAAVLASTAGAGATETPSPAVALPAMPAPTAAVADPALGAVPVVRIRAVPVPVAAPAVVVEPLICKSSLEIGSLVKKRKACFTHKQWAYINDAHEDEARKMMMDNMGRPPGE